MQTWAKRGLQTALVTGGLLMLGTGIASAQENVNPDAPPNPLDARLRIPVDVDHNNLGTPVGNHDLPAIHQEIATPTVAGIPAGKTADTANPLVRGTQEKLALADTGSLTRGNTAGADVVVPVSACGNAVAAGGNAFSEAYCAQSVDGTRDVETDGSYGHLAGNVAHTAAAVSPQVDGNAIAALANAETRGTSDQRATSVGDINTSGEDGSLSGNIAAVQGALPVQVTDNAVAAGGNSRSDAAASNSAAAGGALSTNGDRSTGGGNVLGAPLAPIVAVSGNGVGAAGNADAVSDSRASSDAGGTRPDWRGTPMWTLTSGDDGTLAGNVFQPAFAGPVSSADSGLAGVGNARVTGATTYEAEAGGNSTTKAQDGVLSGNYADTPVALPVSGSGNALSGAGNTTARHANTASSTAGGSTGTNGDRSVLSANSTHLPPAGAVDLCGNGVTAGGNADSLCGNDVTAVSGGYNGTTGNDAVGSGNVGQVPLGLPAETFGNSAGAVGTPSGRATENKVIRSGRVATSVDDNGTVSSNVVSAPTALGGQVFGNSGGAVANPTSQTDSDTTIDLGNPPRANGKHGSASGNIVHVPTSNPAQVFGDSVVGVGNGSSETDSRLDSRSGGTAITTGEQGSLSGNVLSLPEASSPQVFGSAVGAGSNVESQNRNEFGSYSGGDVQTSGDDGSFSGNGLGAQPTVPLQVFGDAVTAAGNGQSQTDSKAGLLAGGRHLTSAEDSAWSGNLFTAPAAVAPAVHSDAVTAGGLADTGSHSRAQSQSGGETTTTGNGAVSARDFELPVEAFARMVGIPVDVLGTATATAQDRNDLRTGADKGNDGPTADAGRGIQLPAAIDSLLRVTEVPNLDVLRRLPGYRLPLSTPGLGELRGLPIQGMGRPGSTARALLAKAPTPGVPGVSLPYAPKPDALQFEDAQTTVLPKAELPTEQLPAVPQAELPTEQLPAVPEVLPLPLPHVTDQLPPLGVVDHVKQARHGLPAVTERARAARYVLPAMAQRVQAVGYAVPVVVDRVQTVGGSLPAVSALTGSLRHDVSDERSFGGTLPLVGDLEGAPALQLLDSLPTRGLPVGVSHGGRDLSTLPVAAPAGLPVVVPVPGVAQPRTAVPMMPPVSMTGQNINPMQGAVGPAELAPDTQAPALADIDARTLFGALEDTTVLPRI